MHLKSRITLDISGYTSNLSKVSAQTAKLAKSMSTAFTGAKQSLADFNTLLSVDAKRSSVFDTLKVHASTVANEVVTSFKRMGKDVISTTGTIAEQAGTHLRKLTAQLLTTDMGKGLLVVGNNIAQALAPLTFHGNNATLAFKGFTTSLKALAATIPSVRQIIYSLQDAIVSLPKRAIQPLVAAIDKANTRLKSWLKNIQGSAYTGSTAIKELENNVKKTGVQFKDVARIVQGIMISKVFYTSLNAIRSATNEVWEFAKALEYSQLVYTTFFGSLGMAKEFTAVLQDFAANTRFGFAELNTAAQQLLAYGFEAKNLMFVLKGVSAAASITGDTNKIESISRALGQINTKGRLMSEEMRQLAEAGIPAYEILQEKLGLTYKQMQNLGDEAVPASLAINALIEGINDRFGGLLVGTNKTMSGMVSNIKDVWLQLMSGVFEPTYNRIKGFVTSTLAFIESLKAAFDNGGIGGLFERLVPKDLQAPLRVLISTLITFIKLVQTMASSFKALIGEILPVLVTWLNILLGIVNTLITPMIYVLNVITGSEMALKGLSKVLLIAAAVRMAYKVHVMAAAVTKAMITIINKTSEALTAMSNTLTKLAQHPFILIAIVLVGLLLATSGAFDKVRDSVNKFFGALNGASSSKLLEPKEMKKSEEAISSYNDTLDTTADAMEAMADSTGKATKAAKALFSFDEVFNNSPDEGDADGINTEWQDFLDGLTSGEFDPTTLLEGIEVADFAEPFVDSLITEFMDSFSTLGERIKQAAKDADIGSLALSGLVSTLVLAIGGFTPTGLFVSLASILTGVFWKDIQDAFGTDADVDMLTLTVGTVAAALAIAVLGPTPVGLFAGIAALIVGGFWDDLLNSFGLEHKYDWYSYILGFVGVVMAAALLGPTPVGLFAAMAALIAAGFWNDIADALGVENPALTGISTAIGGAIGLAVGHPLVGAALGFVAGELVGTFWELIKAKFEEDPSDFIIGGAATAIGAVIGGFLGHPLIGASIGALAGGIASNIWDALTGEVEVETKYSEAALAFKTAMEKINSQIDANILNTKETYDNIVAEYDALEDMVDRVYELSEKEGLSNDEKAEMLSLIGEINGVLPKADIAYDTHTGKINIQKQSILDLMDATENYYLTVAAQDALIVAYKDQVNAQTALDAANRKLNEARSDFIVQQAEYDKKVKETKSISDAAIVMVGYSDAYVEARSNVALLEEQVDKQESVFNKVKAVVDDARDRLNMYTGGTEAAATATKQANIDIDKAIVELGGIFENGKQVTGQRAREIYDGILTGLYGHDDGKGYYNAGDDALYQFGAAMTGALPTLIKQSEESGNQIVQGLMDGIWAFKDPAAERARRLGKEGIMDPFKGLMKIKSPSKVFGEYGENIVNGLIGGIDATEKTSTDRVGTWTGKMTGVLSTWLVDTNKDVGTWATDTYSSIGGWVEDSAKKVKGFVDNVKAGFSTWTTDTKNAVGSWATDTYSSIGGWVEDSAKKVKGFVDNVKTGFTTWTTDTKTAVSSWVTDTYSSIGGWVEDSAKKVKGFVDNVKAGFSTWTTDTKTVVGTWATDTYSSIGGWVEDSAKKVKGFVDNVKAGFSTWTTDTKTVVGTWATDTYSSIGGWVEDSAKKVKGFVDNVKAGFSTWTTDTKTVVSSWVGDINTDLGSFISSSLSSIGTWASSIASKVSGALSNAWDAASGLVGGAVEGISDLFSGGGKTTPKPSLAGHATGGVFNREHIAKFAEGNKAEAIIPLENRSAMQPFVDAIANGITQSLMPTLATIAGTGGGGTNLPPLYVGTLIADDRGLKELHSKFELLTAAENVRRGVNNG